MKTISIIALLLLAVIVLSGCAVVPVYDKDGKVIGHTAPVSVTATIVPPRPVYVVPLGYHHYPRYEYGTYRIRPRIERRVDRLEHRVDRLERR